MLSGCSSLSLEPLCLHHGKHEAHSVPGSPLPLHRRPRHIHVQPAPLEVIWQVVPHKLSGTGRLAIHAVLDAATRKWQRRESGSDEKVAATRKWQRRAQRGYIVSEAPYAQKYRRRASALSVRSEQRSSTSLARLRTYRSIGDAQAPSQFVASLLGRPHLFFESAT